MSISTFRWALIFSGVVAYAAAGTVFAQPISEKQKADPVNYSIASIIYMQISATRELCAKVAPESALDFDLSVLELRERFPDAFTRYDASPYLQIFKSQSGGLIEYMTKVNSEAQIRQICAKTPSNIRE